MSKTPNYDAKVKQILDRLKPCERTCAALGTKWHMDEEEIEMYRKYNVPPSKYHPITRMKLMKSYFVLFDFWYNKNAETGETIISTTHPASGVKVLPDKEWFQRSFDEHARDVDMSRLVFDQIYDLMRDVPQAANYNYVLPENSLAFISLGDQDSFFVLACVSKRTCYAMNSYNVEDSAELTLASNVYNSYNVVHSSRIHNCRFLRECYDCVNCDFCFDVRNCESCFGATNKRNAKYLWFNEQLSKEEWEKRRSEVDLASYEERLSYENKFKELMGTAVWPENFNIKAENCTGEYITDANNIKDGYYVMDGSHDVVQASYLFGVPSNNCHYAVASIGSSDCYYSLGTKNCSWNKFALSIVTNCIDSEYCSSCQDIENCFGCVGLKKKKFCIFNKQYTEGEYWQKLDEIKCKMLDEGEYGDYPPMSFSLQYVQRSGAPIVYGATIEELKKMGANLFDADADGADGPEIDPSTIKSVDDISDRVDESIIGKPFMDEVYGRRFAYLKPEMKLYEKLEVAPPRNHPTRRINELYAEMNIAVFEEMNCSKCNKDIRVGKNRNYPTREVYCKECYLKHLEIYG